MSESNNKPLITFALFAYNQEKYIREAVEGAFSQTYESLEIILSDDCSTDQTFKIMHEMALGYAGPHQIILNQNIHNIGLINHINKIMPLAEGEFIVMAAGDDISMPERSVVLCDSWIKSGYKDMAIFSNALVVDWNSNAVGEYYRSPEVVRNIDDFIKTEKCWMGGFSVGMSKNLFLKYGQILGNTFQEDGVFAFRAILNGGIEYIDQHLVSYRRHDRNSYNPFTAIGYRKIIKSEIEMDKIRLIDLDHHSMPDEITKNKLINILLKRIRINKIKNIFSFYIDIKHILKNVYVSFKKLV